MSAQPIVELVARRRRFSVHVDRHLVLHVSGELDVSTAPWFAVELDRLAIGGGIICVDLASLEFCGAAGINVFVDGVRTLGTRGRLVIYDPSPIVARVINITGLDDLVDVVVGRVVGAPHPAGVTGADRGPVHRTVIASSVASISCGATAVRGLELACLDAEDR
jgi:anti-anti-sigma factor